MVLVSEGARTGKLALVLAELALAGIRPEGIAL